MVWNPSFDFILTDGLNYENLFELVSANDRTRDALKMRCKGCRMIVNRWEREAHYEQHKVIRSKEIACQLATNKEQALVKARAARAAKRQEGTDAQ